MSKKLMFKKDLSRLYNREKRSLSDIAEIYKVNAVTVLNRMKEYGIKRRTVSKSLLGRKITWKDKIGLAHRGKVLSEEHKEKISRTRKSLHIIPFSKGLLKSTHPDLINLGHPGSKHWNWQGGISTENSRLRQSSEYKLWRKKVLGRDNYTCQFCEKRGGFLAAHHLIKFSLLLRSKIKELKDLLFDEVVGMTLCKKCHVKFHKGDLSD